MTTLATRALLASKIRLGRVVIYFYLLTIILVGILTYLANR
ncbi:hypothetical protein QJS83_16760 [Bdellovibrio sp. 22V]|nr:hypothetical protein [Bdellovibrio sp. 22V]WII72115.1 hypothetical protein QJS83_16760 [Bdellovibrio sp. 22V]